MIREVLTVADLEAFLDATALHLDRSIVCRLGPDGKTEVAGWHNQFLANRIGNIGSALPLIFLHERGPFQHRREVLHHLITAQKSGGWEVLSIPGIPSPDATVWALTALAFAGDESTRSAISEAETWLLNQQKTDGSWGATKNDLNEPRVLTTARVIECLCNVSAPHRRPVGDAARWLLNLQRPDGSWAPRAGQSQDGTVLHTAVALRALVRAEIPRDDQAVVKGLEYLAKNWIPDRCSMDEQVEIHAAPDAPGTYNRQVMRHDVDPEVISTLLRLRPRWAATRVFVAVERITAEYAANKRLRPEREPLTVWNTVPQALAVAEYLRSLPVAGVGRAYLLNSSVYVAPDEAMPCGLLVRHLLRYLRHMPLVLAVLLVCAAIAAYFIKWIDGKDLALSLFLPAALAVLEAVVSKRARRTR